MDQNNDYKSIKNFNLNPFDLNGCFYYQPPYFNLPPYNIINNDYLWRNPINNFEFNQNFNQDYSQILLNQSHSFNNNVKCKYIQIDQNDKIDFKENNKIQLKKNENIIIEENKNVEIKENLNKIKSVYKKNYSQQKKNSKPLQISKNKDIHFDSVQNSQISEKHYTILSRNSNKNEFLSNINEISSNILINEKYFPSIIKNESLNKDIIINKNDKLDFKLALQKPKKIDIIEIEEKVNIPDTIKKKRKRKRKKKIQTEEIKQFEYIDDDFPNLEVVKTEICNSIDKVYRQNKNENSIATTSVNQDIDKKKLRRRQLLLILPKHMEDQVKIVDATSIKKSKIKRKVYEDRMKKSIGTLNPLDLTGPTIKRGKERLIPKVKKPSKLKKTILLFRNQKKEIRDNNKKYQLLLDSGDNINDKFENIIEISEKPIDNSTNKIHSKNFREYCTHMVDNNINSIISTILKTLINFQDKLYNRDPIKAKMKRRLCFGLREVTKYVNMKKLRLIIIAPDLEKVDAQGGLDDIVGHIIKVARETSIPCVFALNRSSLAYLCFKKFRVGAIGILNYDGAESQVKELLKAVEEAREQYNQLTQIMQSMAQDASVLPEALNNTFHSQIDETDNANHHHYYSYVGHSRTPSNALSEPISEIIEANRSTFNSIFEDQTHHNIISNSPAHEVNEEVENKFIESFVDNILNSISKLNLK